MHIIQNYCSGENNRVEDEERCWPLTGRDIEFPGQMVIGSSHGGRGGELIKSFRAFSCSQEIADAADGRYGGCTGRGEYWIFATAPSDLVAQAKRWQAAQRREASREKKAMAAAVAEATQKKLAQLTAAQSRATDFCGDVSQWLAAPFHPAPACVVSEKMASGLSWADFEKQNAR